SNVIDSLLQMTVESSHPPCPSDVHMALHFLLRPPLSLAI
ncbi:LOW QUALITY PROTEIN: CCDC138 isoform 9, partial [Pongo abelii]